MRLAVFQHKTDIDSLCARQVFSCLFQIKFYSFFLGFIEVWRFRHVFQKQGIYPVVAHGRLRVLIIMLDEAFKLLFGCFLLVSFGCKG